MSMPGKLRILSVSFALYLFAAVSPVEAQIPICMGELPSIVVSTRDQKLYLCNGKSLDKAYKVSIGKNGWGKAKEGDNRTPVGSYGIGVPHFSDKFYIFIPIDYPTPEQRRLGYTGGAIGIHGPWQPLGREGTVDNIVNWTEGCIALCRNSEIAEITKWVSKFRPRQIHIGQRAVQPARQAGVGIHEAKKAVHFKMAQIDDITLCPPWVPRPPFPINK